MELDDIDSDFSIDYEELNAFNANNDELKRKRDADLISSNFPPGNSMDGVRNSLPHKKLCSAQPAHTPVTNLASASVALDLDSLDFSDDFSDDCFIVGESLKDKLPQANSSNMSGITKNMPGYQNLGTKMQTPSSSLLTPFQLLKPPHLASNSTTTKCIPASKSTPLVIDCDAFFDDLDDEDFEMIIDNKTKTQKATVNPESSNLAAPRKNPTSNLPTKPKAQAVQKTLLNFGYDSSRPPADSDFNKGTGLLQSDRESTGVLRKGLTYAGHYKPPRDCYELHYDYVPLLYCPLAVETWIYPTNYPVRDYQFNIVQKALHENTLVSLPTGLGKTFIAAVVMFNFYRWFPEMKVVFTAPTKPLVAQQIEACYNICGITQKDSIELTGAQSQASRVSAWATKRVFYLTPQVMENDLKSGLVNARDVACIVIDEAHRAQKAYSYVNVVKALYKDNPLVRVLALSATPGTTIQNVQSVVTNLNIARIEFRTEDALDIRPYTFDKEVEKIIVPPGTGIEEMATGLKKLISPYLERLNSKGGYWSKDPDKANVYQLLEARNNFRARSEQRGSRESQVAEGEYALCISLLRILELLIKYGFTTFYSKIKEWLAESGPDAPKYRQQLARNPMFVELLRKTESIVNSPDYHTNFKSHPKVGHLFQYLKRHFELQETAALDGSQQTKVMIFAQFRETVEEVVAILAPLSPAVRPMAFIGQASTKTGKGLKQKDQIEVISKFKRGGYNVLVCTSIGEEGLDIGEVDLIVCYDSSNSPIRMLQRMGRTGRRRKGRVCMLLTQGKEERSFGTSKSTHKSVLKGIKEGNIQYYNLNPRMLPEGVNPTCVKKHIEISPYRPVSASTKGASSRKSTTHGLTPDELDHFHEMYGAAIPIVPSLTRYPVQQCHPGLTHRVRHSNRTKTFVEIMRMCDSAVSNCEDSFLDTKSILPNTSNAPASRAQTSLPKPTPLKPPPENHSSPEKDANFFEGISLSSLSEDAPLVPTNLPTLPSKIPWSDIDSRIKLIFNRHAALVKRSIEIMTTPFKPGSSPLIDTFQCTGLKSSYQSIDPKNNQQSLDVQDIHRIANNQPILQSPTCDTEPKTQFPKPDLNVLEELSSDDFLDYSFNFDTITDVLPVPRSVLAEQEPLDTHLHVPIAQQQPYRNPTTDNETKVPPSKQAFDVPNDLFSDDFLDNSSIFDTIFDALPEPNSTCAGQRHIAIQSPVLTSRQPPCQSPLRRFEVKVTPPKLNSFTSQADSATEPLATNSLSLDHPSNSHPTPSQQEQSLLETPVQVSRRRPRQGPMILSGTPSPQNKQTHKRRKLRAEMDNLMELEAEESGQGGSSEDESNSGDDADDSFVCGDSEIVRECEEEDHESEMPNIYRQSLLSQNQVAEGFYTRPNQFGRQKSNLRYVVSKKPPVTHDSQDQDDSFVVDDSEPVGSEEWTDEHESETLDEDQAKARLESILDLPDTQSDSITNPTLSQSYAEAAAALSANNPPPISPSWQRQFKP